MHLREFSHHRGSVENGCNVVYHNAVHYNTFHYIVDYYIARNRHGVIGSKAEVLTAPG